MDDDSPPTEEDLQNDIKNLEEKLAAKKAQLAKTRRQSTSAIPPSLPPLSFDNVPPHALLLLSDSALPLGSFAFSSGLESYLSHLKHHPSSSSTFSFPSPNKAPPPPPPSKSLPPFLHLCLSSLSSLTLPYVLAAYLTPSLLPILSDALDASILCPVARRASIAQGTALLGVWTRSFKASIAPPAPAPSQPPPSSFLPSSAIPASASASAATAAVEALSTFSQLLRAPLANSSSSLPSLFPPQPPAHYPPLLGVISHALNIPLQATAYIYLLKHAQSVLSAAVRAGVIGPYEAQRVLASGWLKAEIRACLERDWGVGWEEAGQRVVGLDLWGGRHEVLYSRVFNS